MTYLADGTVLIVGEDVYDDGYSAGAVALVGDLFVADAFELAGAALDGSLDVVGGHVFRFCGDYCGAEAGVAIGISAAAWRRW